MELVPIELIKEGNKIVLDNELKLSNTISLNIKLNESGSKIESGSINLEIKF